MDGKESLRRIRELLGEDSAGQWMDTRTTYDVLYQAAKDVAERLKILPESEWIQTQSDVSNYQLAYNHSALYLRDHDMRHYIRLHTSTGEQRMFFTDMEEIDTQHYEKTVDINQGTLTYPTNKLRDTSQNFTAWQTSTGSTDGAAYKIYVTQSDGTNRWGYLGHIPSTSSTDYVNVYSTRTLTSAGWNGDSAGTPSFYRIVKAATGEPQRFSIRNRATMNSQVTGSATSTGTASAGECTLTDTSGLFLTTDVVKPGDYIHNTTDGSTGVVLSITSATALKCALFGGTNNAWATSDAYVIQPMGRRELVLDPPPKTANNLVEVPYCRYPDPVYSDYGVYPFPPRVMDAVIYYAAWLYKYRDEDPDFGDRLFVVYNRMLLQYKQKSSPNGKQRRINVRLNGRRGGRGW